VKFITALLHRAAELADTVIPISKFLEVSNEDGYNMLHAAVIHKKIEIMEMIFDYGTSMYHI